MGWAAAVGEARDAYFSAWPSLVTWGGMGGGRSKFAPDVQEDLVVYNELVLYSAEVLARGGDLRNHASASRTLRPLALEVRHACPRSPEHEAAGSLTGPWRT